MAQLSNQFQFIVNTLCRSYNPDTSDASINAGIENGTFKLYTCIEDVNQYKAGSNYYVNVDSIKTRYTAALIGDASESEIPSEIKEYFNGLRDLIWIVTDDGIGTLKNKNLVIDFEFSKHFAKFE